MFEQTFKNIDNTLRNDANCETELDYAEQSTWALFLKWLDDYEKDKEAIFRLENKEYNSILEDKYRWSSWANFNNSLTGDDLKKLSNNGIRKEELKTLQGLIDANDSDLFDVLEYIAFLKKPISRQARAEEAENNILNSLSENEKEFIEFVLEKYVEGGVEELDISRLGDLIKLKYHTTFDCIQKLGGDEKKIYSTFADFQKYLYQQDLRN